MFAWHDPDAYVQQDDCRGPGFMLILSWLKLNPLHAVPSQSHLISESTAMKMQIKRAYEETTYMPRKTKSTIMP
jgi:hypothetical protein